MWHWMWVNLSPMAGQPCAVLSLGSFPAWLGSVCHRWISYVQSAGTGAANLCPPLEGLGDSKGDAAQILWVAFKSDFGGVCKLG